MSEQQVRVVSIEIKNYKAIEHMLIEFGTNSVVVLEGFNGSGKSSAAQAVLGIFAGGHDPSVIRGYSGKDGKVGAVGLGDVPEAKRASCVMKLSDGTTIERFTTRSGSDWKITTPDGGVVKDAKRDYIDALAKAFEFDPIAFCTAKPDDRVEWFLKIVDVKFPKEDVEAIIGPGKIQGTAPLNLDRLRQIRDGVYERRSETNARHRQAHESWQALFDSLPENPDEDLAAADAELEQRIQGCLTRISNVTATEASKAGSNIADMREQLAEHLADLDREYTAKRQAAIDKGKNFESEANAFVQQAIRDAEAAEQATLNEARMQLGSVRQRKEQAIRQAQARESSERFRGEAVRLKGEADALTTQIDSLDRLRETALADSPFPGIETADLLDAKGKPKGRDLVVRGVPWENVNTSEQLIVAMQIGLEGSGALKFLICDRGSEFDDDKLAGLGPKAAAIGVQLLFTRPEPKALSPRAVT